MQSSRACDGRHQRLTELPAIRVSRVLEVQDHCSPEGGSEMDHNQGSKGGSPELCRYRHVIVPAAVLALCAIALAVLAASPVVWLPVDMGWK